MRMGWPRISLRFIRATVTASEAKQSNPRNDGAET